MNHRLPVGVCSGKRRGRRGHDDSGSAVYTWHCSYYRTESESSDDDSEPTSSSNNT